MEEHRRGIGAGSNKKKDFGDGSIIEKDWSLVYGMVCKVIKQKGAACWSRCLTCLLEAAFNKGRPPADVYFFSHEELVQAIKTDTTTHLEVGSINTAVKRIEKKGLVKLNSKNSWDEDGYRARWKFEVKPNVNCAFVRQQVLLQPVGIIIEVDSEFLDGTGKDFYRVRAIGRGAERHSLILIGSGHTKDGQLFFICQNSWGKKWGFNGLGRLIIDDTCPVFIFYPTGDQLHG
ncbi:thiol protease SEN102-like [Raphanus sativus]|uniref:Thiol protease SEN102-like n=1 Tax=Raphanus sativus TaxID=3726 RepID=A0A6J0K6Z7_RAPSA|nr:thiol protease SEN102-like [Raphanus sativus]